LSWRAARFQEVRRPYDHLRAAEVERTRIARSGCALTCQIGGPGTFLPPCDTASNLGRKSQATRVAQNAGPKASRESRPIRDHNRPNTVEHRGLASTRRQDKPVSLTTPRNLQNLHPRFKSGRRLQIYSAVLVLLAARTIGSGWRLARVTRVRAPSTASQP
jgi:hypothetical protein